MIKTVSALFFIVAILFFLSKCGQKELPDQGYSQTGDIPNYSFAALSGEERLQKILECASCHQETFHNEMAGPHANAYKQLVKHFEFVKESPYVPKEYLKMINDGFEGCVSCHTGENLYETIFSGLELEKNNSRISIENFPHYKNMPVPRVGEESRMLGVDCLTCHVKGNEVITRADFVSKPGIKSCNPRPSIFFSKNENCAMCHKHALQTAANNIHNPLILSDQPCVSCHMEKDSSGAYTHYMYWKHGPPEKDQFPLLKAIIDDLDLKMNTKTSFVMFNWKNTRSSHSISECGEIQVKIDLINFKGDIVAKKVLRLNFREEHHKNLVEYFKNGVPGQTGYSYSPREPALVDSVSIKSGDQVSGAIIKAFFKSQYWLSDSSAVEFYTKKVKI